MSFIEKNKAWVLPLLGLGVLGVAYMNYRTFQGDKPASEEAPSPESTEPAPPATAPPPSEAVEAAKPENASDLWADLQPFAVLPGDLAQESVLKDRARVALDAALGDEPPLSLGRPVAPVLPKSVQKTEAAASSSIAGPLPELEFLVHGPQGSYAWFNGRAYRAGETVRASGYTVNRIGATFVELNGPGGRRLEYTNPGYPFDQKPSNPAEAP